MNTITSDEEHEKAVLLCRERILKVKSAKEDRRAFLYYFRNIYGNLIEKENVRNEKIWKLDWVPLEHKKISEEVREAKKKELNLELNSLVSMVEEKLCNKYDITIKVW